MVSFLAAVLVVVFLWWFMGAFPRNTWSDWYPSIKNGTRGFCRVRQFGKNNYERLSSPYVRLEEKFVPLGQFIGSDYKPVTLDQWQQMFNSKLDYPLPRNFAKKLQKNGS